MARHSSRPVALTIAGSDSGGGAGLQADLKTFAALGVHGTSVVTCITAQNPREVRAVAACQPGLVQAQLETLFAELPPRAAKTGMLFQRAIITTVAAFWAHGRRPPLVVDPVMVASSGARLLQPAAIRCLLDALLPQAVLVTPNLDEAGLLTGQPLREVEDLRAAARFIHQRWGCAALVKGGHLRGLREAVDVFFDGRKEWLLSAPRVPGLSTHGTGCTYSAAITAFLARGHRLSEAVPRAKAVVTAALARSYRAAGHAVLHPPNEGRS